MELLMNCTVRCHGAPTRSPGSRHPLTFERRRFLVDRGLFQGLTHELGK